MKEIIKKPIRNIEKFVCLQCSIVFNSDEYRKEMIYDENLYGDFSKVCFHDICPNCKNPTIKYRKMIALDKKELE